MALPFVKDFAAGQVLLESDVDGLMSNDTLLKTSIDDDGNLSPTAESELTISSGAVTATQNNHTVDTESDAASDELDTITAGGNLQDGCLLWIRPANAARTIVVKHGTGNIELAGARDRSLWDDTMAMALQLRGSTWVEVGPGAVVKMFAAAQVADVASAPGATTWTSWTTLDVSAQAPAGALAAILLVKLTDSAASVAEVTKGGQGGTDLAEFFETSTAALGMASGGKLAIAELDSSGQIDYRYGNSGGSGGTTVGVEIWVKGWIG